MNKNKPKKKLFFFIIFICFVSIIYFLISNYLFLFDVFTKNFKKNFSSEFKIKVKQNLKINIESNMFFLQDLYVYGLKNLGNKSFKNSNLFKKRDLILQDYILSSEQISYTKKQNLLNSITFNNLPGINSEINCVKFYDVKECSIIENSQSSVSENKKLLIYIQGHGGNPYNKEYFIKLKDHYLANGFDILSLSMSNKGYNKEINYFPNIISKYLGIRGYEHEIYKNFYDPEYPNKKPLSLMLSGNFYLINKILSTSDYKKIYAIGISGGGWYVTVLSAIIPQIKQSFSFSGTLPLPLHYFEKNRGDWELSDKNNYKDFNYYDLYALSTIDEFNKKTRMHYQVYSMHDPCCYHKPYSTLMKKSADKLKDKNFKVIELTIKSHEIDTDFLFSKF